MKLRIQVAAVLLALLCPMFAASAESSVGKVLTLREGLEMKILELRRTGDRAVMFRYALTNAGTQEFSGRAIGFDPNAPQFGPEGVSFVDMQGRKIFKCMRSSIVCQGSRGTVLPPGITQEFWVYMTEPPATTSTVMLQVGDSVPQRVTIDPAQ